MADQQQQFGAALRLCQGRPFKAESTPACQQAFIPWRNGMQLVLAGANLLTDAQKAQLITITVEGPLANRLQQPVLPTPAAVFAAVRGYVFQNTTPFSFVSRFMRARLSGHTPAAGNAFEVEVREALLMLDAADVPTKRGLYNQLLAAMDAPTASRLELAPAIVAARDDNAVDSHALMTVFFTALQQELLLNSAMSASVSASAAAAVAAATLVADAESVAQVAAAAASYPRSRSDQRDGRMERPLETVQCFRCQGFGHMKSACPSPSGVGFGKGPAPNSRGGVASASTKRGGKGAQSQ